MKAQIATKHLVFSVNETGNRACLSAPGTQLQWDSEDFWQLSLHDEIKAHEEYNIHSRDQTGKVSQTDADHIHIHYHGLVDVWGDHLQIGLDVLIWLEGELIHFQTIVDNHEETAMVLESRCPVLGFHRLCGNPEEDVFYSMDGLGKRIKNFWAINSIHQGNQNDYTHSQPDVNLFAMYPACCMAWMGIDTGDYFFYMGRHDEKIRLCNFRTTISHPRYRYRKATITSAHLPAVRPGERVETPSTCIALLEGDWREGAKIYRTFAQSTFYHPQPKQEWVRHMHGFHRYNRQGELEKYSVLPFEALPRLHLEGKKYGVDALMLFTYQDLPFIIDFPNHDISPENAARLKEAIREIRQMGGRMILMCNATYIDAHSPFYKAHRDETVHLDIHGDDKLDLFGWANESAWKKTDPYRRLVYGCGGSGLWREHLINLAREMKALGADSVFFDCFGAWPCQPCFNPRHDHGNRVDEIWEGRRKICEAVREICGEDTVFSNEVVTDIAASYTQFIHTLACNQYNSYYDYPEIFRYTFPDVILTNRLLCWEDKNFDRQLRYDFMMGMRYDVGEIYGFSSDKEGGPRYAQIIAEMNNLRAQYGEFIMDGTFTIEDTSPLPEMVLRTEYRAQDGRLLRILYNASDEAKEANGILLQPDEMRFDIFPD